MDKLLIDLQDDAVVYSFELFVNNQTMMIEFDVVNLMYCC